MIKRICVDMSCTIIHNGHLRLLKKANKFGKVVVALTSEYKCTARDLRVLGCDDLGTVVEAI